MADPTPIKDDLLADLIKLLIVSVKNGRMYHSLHPMVEKSQQRLYEILGFILKERAEISIGIIADELVVDRYPLFDLGIISDEFLDTMREKGIERITFKRGVTLKELSEFLTLFRSNIPSREEKKDATAGFFSLEHIKVGKINLEKRDEAKNGENFLKSTELYQQGIKVAKGLIDQFYRTGKIDPFEGRDLVNMLSDAIIGDRSPLLILSNLKSHDEYTYTHSMDVCVLNIVQGEALGLDRGIINDLGMAGLFHDIGKEFLPEVIIKKPGKLNDEEFAQIKRHPFLGARFLRSKDGVGEIASIVAFEHHRRYDQKGYPNISGDKVPHFASLLTQISDVYDAVRTIRSYRAEILPHKAISILKEGRGTEFEPSLLDSFILTMGIYPPATFLLLDSGEIGVVVRTNPSDPSRPQLKIFLDPHGDRILEPIIANLWEKEGKNYMRNVKEVLEPSSLELDPNEIF